MNLTHRNLTAFLMPSVISPYNISGHRAKTGTEHEKTAQPIIHISVSGGLFNKIQTLERYGNCCGSIKLIECPHPLHIVLVEGVGWSGGRRGGEIERKEQTKQSKTNHPKDGRDLTAWSPDLIFWKFPKSLQISSCFKQLEAALNVVNE